MVKWQLLASGARPENRAVTSFLSTLLNLTQPYSKGICYEFIKY